MRFKWLLLLLPGIIFLTACNRNTGTGKTPVSYTLGTYASPPRLDNKRVNSKELIRQLKELNANTYNWLIWQHTTDWDDLKIFLPEAKKNKIKLWVTVVPPTESKPKAKWNSEPFGMDYVKWAEEIAKLSKQHDNIVAWSIDDFAHNLTVYTPSYLQQMLNSAKAINPKLLFIPCLYYRQITANFAKNYEGLLDGVLFPYRAESSTRANLQDATLVGNEIEKVRSLFTKSIPVFLDVYSTAHSQLGASTPEYVRDVVREGMKYADGVLIYTHPNPERESEKYNYVKAGFKK